MYFYFDGIVTKIKDREICVTVSGIGYLVYVGDNFKYIEGQSSRVYVQSIIKEDGTLIYGFNDIEERSFFNKLISVSGIGPKAALSVISIAPVDEIICALCDGNKAFFKQSKKLSDKIIDILFVELKNKYKITRTDDRYVSIRSALKNLGFKVKIIDDVLPGISFVSRSDEEIIKIALLRMSKL